MPIVLVYYVGQKNYCITKWKTINISLSNFFDKKLVHWLCTVCLFWLIIMKLDIVWWNESSKKRSHHIYLHIFTFISWVSFRKFINTQLISNGTSLTFTYNTYIHIYTTPRPIYPVHINHTTIVQIPTQCQRLPLNGIQLFVSTLCTCLYNKLIIVIWIWIVRHHRLTLSNLLGRKPPEFFVTVVIRKYNVLPYEMVTAGEGARDGCSRTVTTGVGCSTVTAGEGASDGCSTIMACVRHSTGPTAAVVICNYWLPVLRWC